MAILPLSHSPVSHSQSLELPCLPTHLSLISLICSPAFIPAPFCQLVARSLHMCLCGSLYPVHALLSPCLPPELTYYLPVCLPMSLVFFICSIKVTPACLCVSCNNETMFQLLNHIGNVPWVGSVEEPTTSSHSLEYLPGALKWMDSACCVQSPACTTETVTRIFKWESITWRSSLTEQVLPIYMCVWIHLK